MKMAFKQTNFSYKISCDSKNKKDKDTTYTVEELRDGKVVKTFSGKGYLWRLFAHNVAMRGA